MNSENSTSFNIKEIKGLRTRLMTKGLSLRDLQKASRTLLFFLDTSLKLAFCRCIIRNIDYMHYLIIIESPLIEEFSFRELRYMQRNNSRYPIRVLLEKVVNKHFSSVFSKTLIIQQNE